MSRPILVIGATGMLGRPVAAALRSASVPVRVLSRDPARASAQLGQGYEIVRGDVSDPASLDRALKGCRGVHVNLRGTSLETIERVEIDGTAAIARAAQKAGVERLTYLSGAGIEAADPRLLPARIKQGAEAAIRASGVPFTILRATHFMESLDLFVRGRHAELLTPQPHKLHYLAAEDYGRQVVRAFEEPDAANKAMTLLGPHPYTMREALDIYVARARPDLTVRELPLAVARILALVVRDPGLKLAVRLFDAFRQIPETGDRSEADALLGPATTTLEDWCDARRHNHG